MSNKPKNIELYKNVKNEAKKKFKVYLYTLILGLLKNIKNVEELILGKNRNQKVF